MGEASASETRNRGESEMTKTYKTHYDNGGRAACGIKTGAALLRRRLFRLFIGVFARGGSLFGTPCAGTAPPPASFRAASPA